MGGIVRSNDEPVVVTGLGLVSPADIGVYPTWRKILDGQCFLSHDPVIGDMPWANSGRIPNFVARDQLGVKQAWRLDRFTQLAIVAAREAVADAGIAMDVCDPSRIAVIMGNSLGGTTTFEQETRTEFSEGYESVSGMLIPKWMPNMLAGSVAIDLGITGEACCVSTACASGTTAVGHGAHLLRSGRYDAVIVGASESSITPTIMAGLAKMGALSKNPDAATASRPFDEERDGFVIAEAAGVLVLERESHYRARSTDDPLAMVCGYGAASDAHHLTAPAPDGRGLQRSVERAIEDAGIAATKIGYVNAHGTSTPMNDRVELATLERLVPENTLVSSTKGATGHALAAAGAMEAVFTVLSLRDRTVPGTVNLRKPPVDTRLTLPSGAGHDVSIEYAMSVSAGFGGHNAAVIFGQAA